MVTALSKLEKYTKIRRFGRDVRTTQDMIADFASESDRGAIILAATSIEDVLEERILDKLPGIASDPAARKRLCDGMLSNFSRKTELAYAMGIIDQDHREKIEVIRKIRNACAHSRNALTLETEALRDAVETVVSDLDFQEPAKRIVRIAFMLKCTLINYYIKTGNKLDGTWPELASKIIEKFKEAKDRQSQPGGGNERP